MKLNTKPLALVAGIAVLTTAFINLPANAATLADSSAQAVKITLAGDDIITAPRTSHLDSDDGVFYTGEAAPVPSALPGILKLGLLTQTADSFTNSTGGHGSEAYAQVASTSLDLATIDDSMAVDLPPVDELLTNALGAFDLGSLSETELSDFLGGVDLTPLIGTGTLAELVDEIEAAVNDAAAEVTPAITAALDEINTNVELKLDAVTAQADANWVDPDGVVATGDSSVADGRIVATIAGKEIVVATLPTASAPNTEVTYNLSAITEAIQTEVLDDLADNLDTILDGELGAPYEELTVALRSGITSQLDTAFAPLFKALDDTVVNATLNKQEEVEGGIAVTALSLEVLPGAADFGVVDLADFDLAHVVALAFEGPETPVEPETPETPDVVVVPPADDVVAPPVVVVPPADDVVAPPVDDGVAPSNTGNPALPSSVPSGK